MSSYARRFVLGLLDKDYRLIVERLSQERIAVPQNLMIPPKGADIKSLSEGRLVVGSEEVVHPV